MNAPISTSESGGTGSALRTLMRFWLLAVLSPLAACGGVSFAPADGGTQAAQEGGPIGVSGFLF
jgi:hypothetical protein